MDRVILHCDMNNFYASVECLYNPELRDKPVAVCGSQAARHGIVLAKNYIAKGLGVKTGEVIWQAKQKCPNLVTVRPNYSLYLKFSRMAREIYQTYTDQVEAFGIDESWIDVTYSVGIFGDGPTIAYQIKERIKEELGVTASVGVSFNKIFAKLGSDMKKPDAITIITPENFKDKVWRLPAEDLLYIGPSTKRKLYKVGIFTIGDVANVAPGFLVKMLGKWGETLWSFANGYDTMPVRKNGFESVIKGVGNSLTSPRDLTCNKDVKTLLYVLAESVGARLRRHNMQGKTVQIYIRDTELNGIERQAQLDTHTYISSEIAEKAYQIFLKSWNWDKNIRSIGVRVTDLVMAGTYIQMSIFMDDRRFKREIIDHCVDNIRERFGHCSVQRGLTIGDRAFHANPAEENIIHPISYFR